VKALPRHALIRPAWLLVALLVLAACGGPGAQGSPTASASAEATPDPHLREPARADVIYSTLVQRGLGLIGTNASRGKDPVAVINATYAGWPLVLTQYRTSDTRNKLFPIKSAESPKKGDPPFIFAGLNVVIKWGPEVDGKAPRPATKSQVEDAGKLATELDRLIGPLLERSVFPVAPKGRRP
jgi:hypothetical protein